MTTDHVDGKRVALLLNLRRVIQGAWFFVPGALAVLFSGSIGSVVKLQPWHIAVAGLFALVVGLYWSASGARCPSCRLNLLWHGMAHARHADWFTWLVAVRSCPRCGYSASVHSDRHAG